VIRKVRKAFSDRIEDQEIKVARLILGEMTVNEDLRQELKLKVVIPAQGSTRIAPRY
jgi:hypothetical protein